MEGSPGATPTEPTPESVLDFLCTPGVDSDVATLVRRGREISAEPEQLFAAPAEERILKKLVWPLLHAKGSCRPPWVARARRWLLLRLGARIRPSPKATGR